MILKANIDIVMS